jgi:hypothetical protein
VSPEQDPDRDRAPDRAPGRDPMAATDQAGNAELVIDEDLDPEEPGATPPSTPSGSSGTPSR